MLKLSVARILLAGESRTVEPGADRRTSLCPSRRPSVAAASAAGVHIAQATNTQVHVDHEVPAKFAQPQPQPQVQPMAHAAREHHFVWSPFLGQAVDSSSFAPWALWHSPASAAPRAFTHAAASEKHSTLMSLLSLPLIRKRFLAALPSWLHHSESESHADAHHLDFLETEDAMKVSVRLAVFFPCRAVIL